MADHQDVLLKNVLRGQGDGAQSSKACSNMVRVFISSTFTDMSTERKTLLDKAYPEVRSFCRSLGLLFEVVDLRWGFRNDTSDDHKSCEIFLQEIENCKRISAGPAFAALLGNRYGHRALPRLIPEKLFEVLLSKLSNNPEDTKQLNMWFLKDSNAVPPTYVLQPITAHFPHYSDHRPDSKPQQENNARSWRLTETQLLKLLRSAAAAAETDGDITVEQKQHFFSSVLEREFEQGLWKDDSQHSALLFVREIPKKKARDGPKLLAKYMDITANGLLDAESLGLLTDLKSQLYTLSKTILNLHCVELNRGSLDPKRKEHAQYLDSICEEFVSQMKARITAMVDSPSRGGQRKMWGSTEQNEQTSDWVVEEVRQHAAMSAELCKNLHGREGLLGKICMAMWESTNDQHSPLVVHGASGMGKTALLCKLAQEMQKVVEAGSTVVIRLLSVHHSRRLDLDHVLHSICLQVCLACGLSLPSILMAGTHLELLKFFKNVLAQVSKQGKTVLIILDAIDQLSEQHQAHSLNWLPEDLPPNVHIVVSMDTNSEVFAYMRLKMENLERFFEVERLSHDDGKKIVESTLTAWQRTLTPEQSNAVLKCFDETGCPLHLKLILAAAKHWTSYTPPTDLHLGNSIKEMISQFFQMLEGKHGKALVGGALGYLALARHGLLEAELRDIMSLDDNILSEVYRHTIPPIRALIRLPPLLWLRLKRDLEELLEEQWRSGVIFITFKDRHLADAVSSRYLTSEFRGQSYRILAEYFLGRWSGKLKPAALPGLSLVLSDRKVPPQPMWFAPGLANMRKLQELPYHLVRARLWEELQQEVIGNAEWLYWKSRVCGVSSVIEDLDYCAQYMDCMETRLIRDTLVLIKPSLDFLDSCMDMSVFLTELMARLCSLAQNYPTVIGQLCSQCEEWLLTCQEPNLLPKCSFIQQAGGALQHTINGLHGGVVCLDVSAGAELVVTGSNDGVVSVWSLGDQHLMHTLLGHTGPLLRVKVVESSACCFSLASDGSLRKWSLLNGKQQLCIPEVLPVDSSPSSVQLQLFAQKQLICVHTRTQVKMWTLDGAEHFSSCSEEGSLFLGVLEESVFSLTHSGLVRISNPADRTKTVETQLESSKICLTRLNSVLLPKQGKVIVVTSAGFLHQISKTGTHSSVEFSAVTSFLTVTEDEKILIVAFECTLSLFKLNTNTMDAFLNLNHDDTVLCASMSSDGRLLASGASDQLIHIWSVTTGSCMDTLCGSDAAVTSVCWYKGFVVSASTATASIQMWDPKYDPLHKPITHIPSDSAHVAFTKDSDRIFFVRQQSEKEIVSWNTQNGCVSEHLPTSSEVCCLEVSQQRRLLFAGLISGTILIYPLALPQETLCIPPPESLCGVVCLTICSKEKHLVVAYEDSVCLFEIGCRDRFPTVEGPVERFSLPPNHSPLSSMALFCDRRLLYGTSCGEVKLYNFNNSTSSTLEAHSSRVSCVTASNWGTHALVGSEDAVQRLWSMDPVVLDHTMEYKGFFFEGVLSAAFAESDHFVFTGSQDRTIKVWDVAKGTLLYVQYVYSPTVKMLTYRNGFVALSRQGCIIREVFRCPDDISPDYNPLRNVKAHYRVTSREKKDGQQQGSESELQEYNPAQFNLNLISMLRDKPSATCLIL